MDSNAATQTEASRTQARESIFLSARVRFASLDEIVTVRIRNISSGGMMVDCDQPVGPGETLEAEIKNIGRIRGRIAWRTDNRMGIAFNFPIDPKRARVKAEPDNREPIYTNLDFGPRRPGLTLR
ncbi:MAG: PilZ domain-containing protein [Sphingomonadales bacterium]|jgi:hypothetical protein|nr:PilZ domain-containing protein [Sphingomonadales bacterium]